jgi:hypothetical protein
MIAMVKAISSVGRLEGRRTWSRCFLHILNLYAKVRTLPPFPLHLPLAC